MPKPQKHVFICTQKRPEGHPRGCCQDKGVGVILDEFRRQFDERDLYGTYMVTTSGCIGPCDLGPNVLVYPEGIMYSSVKAEDVTEIIESHLLGDTPVDRLRTPADIWG